MRYTHVIFAQPALEKLQDSLGEIHTAQTQRPLEVGQIDLRVPCRVPSERLLERRKQLRIERGGATRGTLHGSSSTMPCRT